uniref:Uncharacterized protein n=1 Tax=Romanomermis culicivorax TaxID=13658 RepID=A0A915JY81_ROMCU
MCKKTRKKFDRPKNTKILVITHVSSKNVRASWDPANYPRNLLCNDKRTNRAYLGKWNRGGNRWFVVLNIRSTNKCGRGNGSGRANRPCTDRGIGRSSRPADRCIGRVYHNRSAHFRPGLCGSGETSLNFGGHLHLKPKSKSSQTAWGAQSFLEASRHSLISNSMLIHYYFRDKFALAFADRATYQRSHPCNGKKIVEHRPIVRKWRTDDSRFD